MNLVGFLKSVKDTQVVTDKFQKREFVIETNEKFQQTIQIELQGDKCDIIDAYSIGQEITVDINIRGRVWVNPQGEEKVFNTIVAWKIQPSNAPVGGNTTKAQTQTAPIEATPILGDNEDDGDPLPF